MAEQAAYLVIWLIGLFGIVGILIGLLARLIQRDTWEYDETFIWQRKIKE
ncbi:hypothetical protein ACFQZE_08175 [Paenibacillus sp. GCM10027627]